MSYDRLHAKEFTLRADDERIVISFDLSTNQRVANKSANRYIDVQRLIEDSDEVELFELGKEAWLVRPLSAGKAKSSQCCRVH